MNLTEISIKRPSLIVVIFTVLSILGAISYSTLGYELIPKFSAPIITVSTIYPGASPGEIENTVSKKVEDAVSSLENIKRMSTISQENASFVVIELAAGADVDAAIRDCQRKLNLIVPTLPTGCKTPAVNKIGSADFPVMQLGISSKLEPTEFFQLVKDDIKPQLASCKGVADVNIIGGEERAVRVNVNQDKLEFLHVSLLQVVQAIGNANMDFPTGKVKSDEEQIRVRLAGKFSNIEDLKELVVAQFPNGTSVKLHQVADVTDAKKDPTTINRINGITSVGVGILKQSDANGVEVSSIVTKRVEELNKRYESKGVKITISQDASDFTIKAADAVKHDLLYAIILVALVIVVFLHSLKDSFIVMLAIPTSFIATFIGFYIFDFTLNLMTMLGLTLVVGILVDDSIVVLENIHRHLAMGKNPRQAAADGRTEIGFTAISITLVDVVVFLPLALSNAGIISSILRQFSWVIVISTLLSLFVSFTITPLLASRISKLQHLTKETAWGRVNLWLEEQITNLIENYVGVLAWCLNHKVITMIVVGLLFIGSFALPAMGLIGSEFVNRGDRGECILYVELDKTATLENTNRLSQRAEKLLQAMPEVSMVFANVGGSSSMNVGSSGQYKSEISVKLVPKNQRNISTEDWVLKARKILQQEIVGAKITGAPVNFMGGADQPPIQLIIMGENYDSLMYYANNLKKRVSAVKGMNDVKLSVEEGIPEVKIEMDKEKLASFGLNVAMVGGTLQTAFAGNDASKYRQGTTEYDIVVMLDGFNRKNVNDVKDISFMNQMGQTVKLSQFASITPSSGSSQLQRSDRRSSVTLEAQLLGIEPGTGATKVKEVLKDMKLPPSINTVFIGAVADQENSFGTIGIAFLVSILFVYLIMVALYDSYIYPLVVLFSIPVALIGALLALALTKNNFSIFTLLGMVTMNGLVAKNAILIVDFANKLKKDGHNTYDALIEAGRERLRPILMTTFAMILGMLPIALSKDAGSEWKNGLAWALIGGLTSSMLLTIIVVPIMYTIVDKIKAKTGFKD